MQQERASVGTAEQKKREGVQAALILWKNTNGIKKMVNGWKGLNRLKNKLIGALSLPSSKPERQ